MSSGQPLASRLKEAIDRNGTSIDRVSNNTKVPRTTVRALIGEVNEPSLVPARVYLRGHLKLIAAELGIPQDEAERLFDESYPAAQIDTALNADLPRFRPSLVAIAGALAGVGILAVILSILA
jgi:cytoskeletal protein RodZ